MTRYLEKLRRMLTAIRSTKRDQDLEQAYLRVIVSSIALAYVWFLILLDRHISPGLLMGLAAGTGNAIVGAAMIWALRARKVGAVPLRYIGAISDAVALSVGMAGAGEYGVAVIGVYLWVTIGNGFRFGPKYLRFSYWLSILGFALQLLLVPFWDQHMIVGVGLLLALAIVPIYVLLLLIRLTAQKDEAEQLSNAKSRFVANVSHELRTPLTGVYAVYDLLRIRKLTPDDRELIGMLGNAIKTLRSSVDAVLQMSKLEAGAERAQKLPFNLWFLINQIASIVRPQSVTKGLAWQLEIRPDVPTTVVGDPDHLSHILGNLLNNAFKFTSVGVVSLRVSRGEQNNVRFEVVDTGIGIPIDQQERLFERFVQVDSSATRRHGGTGLGTSIARDLTELMGGTIGIVSAPGQGSTFWVELPLALPVDNPVDIDWGALRKVLIVGRLGSEIDQMAALLREIGLEPIIYDAARDGTPNFDAQALFAAIIVMSAGEAANYAENMLHDGDGAACPWLVSAPSFSAMQRASLLQNGAAALLPSLPSIESLRQNLASLIYRLEVASSADAIALPSGGIVKPLAILLADDNHSNQLLLARILKDAGHKVDLAQRGDDAFDRMAAGGIDIAILDLNMPDMTGPEVVKLFRASSVGAKKMPILILSADATPAAKLESLQAGADEFLTKPITAPTLLAAIERIVAGAAAVAAEDGFNTHKESVALPLQAPALVNSDRVQSLRRISRGDSKFLDAYMSAAFADLERALSDLGSAIEAGNARSARDALHIIEGTGASVGATALVANCKSMRHYVEVPQDPDRASALAELSTIYALTKSTLLASAHGSRDVSSPSKSARR
jgi:two-component system, sensor histidine kinase RpfC